MVGKIAKFGVKNYGSTVSCVAIPTSTGIGVVNKIKMLCKIITKGTKGENNDSSSIKNKKYEGFKNN